MVGESHAAEFFETQFEDFNNCLCCDSGRVQPFWASVSYGIYISIEAAGIHRSLGVKVSRVQSITMDSWKPIHLMMMQLGGNRKFNDFLKEHGIPEDMPIREKYNTRAAEWYRENLSALAQGLQPLAQLLPGTGRLPVDRYPTPEQKKLDEVFSICHDSSSLAEMQKSYRASPKAGGKSVCDRLCACLRVHDHGSQINETVGSSPPPHDKSSDLDRLLPDYSLPKFLLNFTQNEKAWRTLSS